VVIPAAVREKAGFHPGSQLEVTVEDGSVRLIRTAPGPKVVRASKRLVARPTAQPQDLPSVDVAALVAEERNRWPG
jgi:AbrB family looped-hinge helix DNA binding protein